MGMCICKIYHYRKLLQLHGNPILRVITITTVKKKVPRTGGGTQRDFGHLHSCHLLSYRFVQHTFGWNKGRRRFLRLTVVVHLVSFVLQLVFTVTQPIYLATRT